LVRLFSHTLLYIIWRNIWNKMYAYETHFIPDIFQFPQFEIILVKKSFTYRIRIPSYAIDDDSQAFQNNEMSIIFKNNARSLARCITT
jgi:hypothetical protein